MTEKFENSEKAVVCWLATVDSTNRPNVSLKEIFTELGGDQLLIAEISSARCANNIRTNPAVCVSLIDVFLQSGQQLEGVAELVPSDHPTFTTLASPLIDMVGDEFTIRHVISIRIERRSLIVAPNYILHPGRSETELRNNAYRTYGERRLLDLKGRFKTLVPMLQCQNIKATKEWYHSVLGFRCVGKVEDAWCRLERDGVAIMFMQNTHLGVPQATATQYIYVDDVLGLWDSIKHICNAEWGPAVMPYGMLEFAIKDLNGYLLSFGQPTV